MNPPASFEQEGQKVRTPDRVLGSKLGTCIDLTVLLAACLEQAGLHPVVFLMRDHAFAGVWLDEKTFSTAALDDPVEVRKRIDNDEMVAIETTLLTGAGALPFDKAKAEGRRRLEDTAAFACAVDVARARKAQIRPIQGRLSQAGEFVPVVMKAPKRASVDGPLPAAPSVREAGPEDTAPALGETRLDRWRRKLLDLTLNNRLLNFRATKKTLPLLCADLGELEDRLADGARFRLMPRPTELGATDAREAGSYRRRTGDEGLDEVVREAVRSKRIHVDLDEQTLTPRLIGMYREARLAMEESGTSALYCALGFLTWFTKEESEKPRQAPILLVPVNLLRKSVEHGFNLEIGDDEPRINVSLLEMLAQDFDLDIAGLDPLPMDEHGVDVPRVFETFRRAVQGIRRWEVRETACVGVFSFSKFLMWRDLQEHAQDLLENEVVAHLVHHRDKAFDPGAPIPRAEELDRERVPEETFCPLSADSSQLQAVFAAADGRSFVLEGPPGTGKSQTITNLIAQCLANGKTVLFVAEKNVALRVVHERLEKIGLGDFCLELHSNKARKADVMQQLGRAMARPADRAPEGWQRETRRLGALRTDLNAYVEALHAPQESGESVFHGLAQVIHHRDAPRVRLAWQSTADMTAERLAALREVVKSLRTVGQAAGSLHAHPWRLVGFRDWTPLWQRQVEDALARAARAKEHVARAGSDVATLLGFAAGGWSWPQLQAMAGAAACLLDPPAVPQPLVTEGCWTEMRAGVLDLAAHGRARDGLRPAVFARFRDAVLALDVTTLLDGLHARATSWGPIRWFHRVLVRWKLRPVLAPGAKLPDAELEGALELAKALQAEEEAARRAGKDWGGSLAQLFRGGEADWAAVEGALDWAGAARTAALTAAGDDPSAAASYRRRWADLATEAPDAFRADGAHAARLRGLHDAWVELESAMAQLEGALHLREGLVADARAPGALAALGPNQAYFLRCSGN